MRLTKIVKSSHVHTYMQLSQEAFTSVENAFLTFACMFRENSVAQIRIQDIFNRLYLRSMLVDCMHEYNVWHVCMYEHITSSQYYQPENQDDVEAIVADCAANKRRLRVLGSGLSPNGVGFSDEGMMSMALLDGIQWVDTESMQVI